MYIGNLSPYWQGPGQWYQFIKMQEFGEVGLFLLAFFLLSNYGAVATETDFDVSKHLVHSYDTKDGCQAAIFDDLFTEELLEQVRIAAFHFGLWDYHDKLGDVDKSNFLWRSEMQLEFFSKTRLWETMRRAVSGVTHKTLYPYSVTGTIMRRFEPLILEETTSGDYMVMLFLSNNWKKNDYGNLSLYSKHRNGSVSSILWTAHPQSGRITYWNGALPHMYHPPSINQVFSGLILLVQATESKDKYEYELEKSNKRVLETENKFFKADVFPTLPGTIPKYDLDKHLTRKFYDGEGRPVAVYDNLFTKEQLDLFYQFLTTVKGRLRFADTDVTLPEDGDNVNWIKLFTVDAFLPSNVWNVVSQVVQHISNNNRTEWYPYDVSLNVIRNADHTRIHQDCEGFEDEFTFLLYMNPDWDVNKYGETIFFDEIDDPITHRVGEGTGNEQYEPIGAVTPKYGRVAIFSGIIPHSARPPSADVHNARYTFAVKVSKDKRTATGKSLREAMEDQDLTDKELLLLSKLYYSNIDAHITDDHLYKSLKNIQNKRDDIIKTYTQDAMDFLLRDPQN